MTTERIRPTTTPETHGGPGGGSFDPIAADLVAVTAGPYSERLPLAGRTVAQVRRRFADRFDLDPQAVAVVDGQPAADDTVLAADQVLTFFRPSGEKGAT